MDLSNSKLLSSFLPKLSRTETLDLIKDIDKWYHTVWLGHDIFTDGIRDSLWMLEKFQLDNDYNGKTVLDIGAADGFFSFEMEARGAKKVTPTDLPGGQFGIKDTTNRFKILKNIYNSKIELEEMDILTVDEENFGKFDTVLFLGVLYHLTDPFLAIRKLKKMTKECLILETRIASVETQKLDIFNGEDTPIMVFIEKNQLSNDPSNWWLPNIPCLIGMLEAAGFQRIELLDVSIDPKTNMGGAIVIAYA